MNITDFIQKYTQSEMMTKRFIYTCNLFCFTEVEQIANADVATLEHFRNRFGPRRWSVIEPRIMRFKERPIFEKLPQGTQRMQIVMDYEDLTRMMNEMADKVVNKVLELIKAEHPKEQDELMTAREVAALFSVTNKTLHVWDKSGFLPRVRIGGVVRYRRADVERVAQVKSKD